MASGDMLHFVRASLSALPSQSRLTTVEFRHAPLLSPFANVMIE